MGAGHNIKYPEEFETWATYEKFPKTGAGGAAKYQCYRAWCAGGSIVIEKQEKIVFDVVNETSRVNKNGDLTNAQLNQKIDLMGSNIQGQMFAGFDKNEKEIEELRDQLETLRGQLNMLQQNLSQLASRPSLDMTRY
jgi:polyhydroxyalkanoate synthesis regulator phasin